MSNNKQDYEEVWNTVSETTELDIFKAYGVLEEPEDKETEDPKSTTDTTSVPPVDALSAGTTSEPASVDGEGDNPKSASQDASVEAVNSNDGGTDDPKSSEAGTSIGTIRTDAGLIDPETGEILEPSFILSKLGWTEFPELNKNATAEEIKDFEEKVDQIADRILSSREKAARYRAACELKCKPLDSSADFWEEQFLIPMAKKLGPHVLRKTKTGKWANKTHVLNSGAVKFTKAGGWSVFDSNLVKAHIKAEGVEKFKLIEAKETIQYTDAKLRSALNKGKLKDLPGTVHKAVDDFAKVKLVAPGAADSKEEADNGDE